MKIKLPWLFFLSMLGMPVLAQTAYCPASAGSNYYTATSNVTLGNINNIPGAGYTNFPGYTDHSNLSTDVPAGGTLPFSVSVGRNSFPQSYYKIFADFNGDGIFSANELAYSKGPTTDTSISGNIAIPENAVAKKVRIRVMQSPYIFNNACGSIGTYGEVDDYSLNITKAPYCSAEATYAYYTAINSVTFGNFSNNKANPAVSGNPYPGYGDFTSISTTANPGDSVPLSVTTSTPPGSTSYVAAYVDFNNNGIFEANERVLNTSWKSENGVTNKTINTNVQIPLDAVSGSVRVRIMQSVDPFDKACGSIGNNGEVEDYTLVITCKVAKPSATSVSYCGPSNATLSVINPLANLSYSWHSALTNGTQLGYGTSYSTFANTSTTVYLQAQNGQGCFSERTPVSININTCCSSASYTVAPIANAVDKNGKLFFYVTNNQSTSQTVTISIPSGLANSYASTSGTSKSVTLSPGQSSLIEFSGSHPISSGTYNQSITIKDSKCTLNYSIPVKVDTSLGFDNIFDYFTISPTTFKNSFTIKNGSRYNASYVLNDENQKPVANGSLTTQSTVTVSLPAQICIPSCKTKVYTLFIDMGSGIYKSYPLTRQP